MKARPEPRSRAHEPGTADLVQTCSNRRALLECARGECAELAIWPRTVTAEVRTAFEALDLTGFQDLFLTGSSGEISSGLSAALDQLGWPQSAANLVRQDVDELVRLTSHWSPSYRLRLEHVSDDSCRKFHKDRTDIRLITTYKGRGSQWCDVGDDGQGADVRELLTFETGAFVGLRKAHPQRILHRSPPIGAGDTSRLVLVLDIERPSWTAAHKRLRRGADRG